MTSQADKDLHAIALTLRDILKELKRFNANYEKAMSPYNSIKIASTDGGVMLLGKEDPDGEPGSDE